MGQMSVALQLSQIIAIEQPIDLLGVEFDLLHRQVNWPAKPCFVDALHPQDKSITFPAHHLDERSVGITEHEQGGVEGVQCHLAFDDGHEAINRLAHVHGWAVKKDLGIG